MIHLAVTELREGWRSWTGALAVVFVAALLLGACATIASTWLAVAADATRPAGVADVLLQLTIMVSGFSGVSAVVVLSAVASVAVHTDRTRYGRWQILGITPLQVRGIITVQLVLLGVVGAIGGLIVAALCAHPTIDLVVRAIEAASGSVEAVPAVMSPPLAVLAGGVVVVVVLASGLAPAKRASRVSPMEALRGPELPKLGMSVTRWITAAVCAAASIALLASTFGNSPDIISLNTIFACITTAGGLAAAAPLVLPPLLRWWPRVLPDRWSVSWFLARTGASHRLQYSASSVTPLMVGITIIGAIFSAAYTQRDSMLANNVPVDRMSLAGDQVAIMLGGPLLLAVVGSAAVIFQGSRDRAEAASVLSRAGVGRRTLLAAAAYEGIINVGTALLAALLVIVLVVGVEALALGGALGPTWPVIYAPPIAAITALGLAVVVLASLSTVLTNRITSAPRSV